MHQNLVTSIARADELLRDLLAEYNACLGKKAVSDRATQLTHDVCEKLRSVLDRTARRYWDLHVAPNVSKVDRKVATVYFPIVPNQANMDASLGRWRWKSVRQQHQPVYDYLLSQQPFNNANNRWLTVVNDLAIAGKHIESRRGQHSVYVFDFDGHPVKRILNTGWKKARERAGLSQVRVHDLKHTFGRRLRAAGVSFEDRQDLLGHRSGRITTHYSAVELGRLIEAAEKVAEQNGKRPELVVLRGKLGTNSRKTPARAVS